MSIGGLMRTSVSGMNAQATRLAAVSDNIANSDTTGYKKTTTEFSSQLLASSAHQYNSGAVEAQSVTHISEQGGLSYTSNSKSAAKVDLAVSGNGFFVVSDGNGGNFLTRAGSFTQQADGSLVNAAGYTLMGYPVSENGGTDFVLNGYAGLEQVNLTAGLLSASPTTSGNLTVNLDKSVAAIDPAAAGVSIPSETSTATAAGTPVSYTTKTSLVAYDNSGQAVTLDIYYTKVSDNQWEMSVFNAKDAASSTLTDANYSSTAPFPYGSNALTTKTLNFDPTTYTLKDDPATAANETVVDIAIPDGQTLKLDIGNSTQYTSEFLATVAKVNGNPAEVIDTISVGNDGTITATFTSGTTRDLYKVPLALVASANNMTAISGNVFDPGVESGSVLMGFGGSGGFGDVVAGALEDSTVDLASELTTMIGAQRSYTANSKVFQTGSEILDVLVNLKR